MYEVQLKNTKEIYDFCMLNGITDINKFIQECFKQGFDIQRYGLLDNTGEKEKIVEIPVEVIKEVEKIIEITKEVPVEVIREIDKVIEVVKEVPVDRVVEKVIEVVKEIPVEKVVVKEIVKEVPVDRVVEKEVYITDDSQVKELGDKVAKLNNDRDELLLKIQQLESDKQLFSTKIYELEGERQKFSTKTEEMENIFQKDVKRYDTQISEYLQKINELENKPPVEIIKEVFIEKQNDNSSKLQETLQKLREQILQKDSEILELKNKINDFNKLQQDQKALYLRGSNLDDKLYK